MTLILLICAVIAALSGGVLLAYAICYGMFQVFRIHSLQVAQQRVERNAARALAGGADLIAG